MSTATLKKLSQKFSLNAGTVICVFFISLFFVQYIAPYFWATIDSKLKSYENLLILTSGLAFLGWLIALFAVRRGYIPTGKIFVFRVPKVVDQLLEVCAWMLFIYSALALSGKSIMDAPLFVALSGNSPDKIFQSRVSFDLARTGTDLIYVYIQNFLSIIIIPFYVLRDAHKNTKYFWFKLLIVIVILSFPLAKSNGLKVFLPLLSYFFFTFRFKRFFAMLGIAIMHLLLMYFLFFGAQRSEFLDFNPPDTSTSNFLIGSKGVAGMLNRILWIPYITGVKWFEYSEVENLPAHKPVVSNRSLALLIHGEYRQIEKQVFSFQFGLPPDMLIGFANTTYFVDSYVKYSMASFFFVIFALPLFLVFCAQRIALPYVHLLSYFLLFLTANSAFSFFILGGWIFLILASVDVSYGKFSLKFGMSKKK
ncbi:hypothetical protein [Bdellovibrio sp. HCB209]|uniref:hypothetical protein n=1 Tax=Bdellovibrio sp. HCB209 TaxID=3394354 RepID=UPI0039B420AB